MQNLLIKSFWIHLTTEAMTHKDSRGYRQQVQKMVHHSDIIKFGTSLQNVQKHKTNIYQGGCQETCDKRSLKNIWRVQITLCMWQQTLVIWTLGKCLDSGIKVF